MMLEKKQMILIAAGVGIGLISLFLVKMYLDQQRRLALEDAERKAVNVVSSSVTVLVANRDIQPGSPIDSGSVTSEIVPMQMAQPNAVASVASAAGMIAAIPISKGEQITFNKLQSPQSQQQFSTLASSTPVGKRAVTIQVDNIASLAGMIKPGDYVDVTAILPVPMQTADGKQQLQSAVIPLFQNVLVLAVGRETGTVIRSAAATTTRYKAEGSAPAERSDANQLITLALSLQEANLVAYVQEQGKIRLFLRSKADAETPSVQVVTPGNVTQFLQSVLPQPGPEQGIKTEKTETVEIIKGSKKEQMPLTK
jgi:pilus assembly protein CpaB